ncbi:single-stranded DNA-binding protein [Sulfitobacter sp.]|uniref:single-stranded DNA-binding protein n=1 Tax=Sulfitobacter sp. TaxID=1903071 RepID=UPI003F6B7351
MQILTIAGNVGKDAALRRTGNGDAVLGFSVAVDQGKDSGGNKRPALWVDCSIWGKRAESLESYIVKGTKLALTGRPTVRAHEGKAYLGLSVDNLTFMGGGQSGGESSGGYGGQSSGGYQAPPAGDLDDSIPF